MIGSSGLAEGLARARSPNRLYRILPGPCYDFYAGGTRDGRQLLAGEWSPDLLVGLFDEAGILRDVHYRTIVEKTEAEQRLHEWYGYTPGPIRVKRFRIDPAPGQAINALQLALVGESGFAIAPFPPSWPECYDEPSESPKADPDYMEMIRGWIERGNFVLIWGNELHLDASGEVVGT